MSTEALREMVIEEENSRPNSQSSDSNSVFDVFDARLEQLVWKENESGVLFVAASRVNPDNIVQISLENGSLTTDSVSCRETGWSTFRTVSTPQTASSPQFD